MDLTTYFSNQINAVDSALSNEGNKRSLYNTLTTMFFMYEPSDSDITAFRGQRHHGLPHCHRPATGQSPLHRRGHRTPPGRTRQPN